MDKKKITIVYVIATAMILGLLGYTYAYFSATVKENNKTETVITTDKLTLTFTGTSEITAEDMIPGDSFTKTFTVENTSEVDTKYNIYMENITNEFNEDLVYILSDENGVVVAETSLPTTNIGKTYLISDVEIQSGVTKTYTLKIEYKYLDTPQNDYQGSEFRATLGVDTNKIENNVVNPDGVQTSDIVAAYTYNEDSTAANYCVTGNEATCVETTCYKTKDANSCASGTIVDYRVNDNETVRFHVMYDNGSTMTMQSQKNTVYNVPWISNEDYVTVNTDETICNYNTCNDEGPITALNLLESKTSIWSNVNTQTYILGTTTFKANAFTGCSNYDLCDNNTYVLAKRIVKARMITIQEASSFGCTSNSNKCPIWMYNYLENSINYGGTVNDLNTETNLRNAFYWTLSSHSTAQSSAWDIFGDGFAYGGNVYNDLGGARAVVEINK